jgi:hypothetical protein
MSTYPDEAYDYSLFLLFVKEHLCLPVPEHPAPPHTLLRSYGGELTDSDYRLLTHSATALTKLWAPCRLPVKLIQEAVYLVYSRPEVIGMLSTESPVPVQPKVATECKPDTTDADAEAMATEFPIFTLPPSTTAAPNADQ